MKTIDITDKLYIMLTKLKDEPYSGYKNYTEVIEAMLYASRFDEGLDYQYFKDA